MTKPEAGEKRMMIKEFANATLYCGDCRDLLPQIVRGGGVDAVITDPPYGIRYKTRNRKVMETPERLANDDKPPIWSVPLMVDAVMDGGALYICTRFDVMHIWQSAISAAGAKPKTPIVWDKGGWSMGDLTGDYGNRCELILFAHKGRHKLKDGRPSNLWQIPRCPPGEHPTPKPVELMRRCVHNSVLPGGTVLDPFMGSGSTGIAAMLEGCRFIGIELEPKYFDIACRRIEAAENQQSLFGL